MQEADGDAFDTFALQDRYDSADSGGVERQQDVAFVVEAFGDG
jgi:hypothetical protein